ncbi:MAG: hypothetical protein HYW80_00675 [Parcubacteria group bacterium]|nr:hypothetical protein [Parcubacteria group bacterium]
MPTLLIKAKGKNFRLKIAPREDILRALDKFLKENRIDLTSFQSVVFDFNENDGETSRRISEAIRAALIFGLKKEAVFR